MSRTGRCGPTCRICAAARRVPVTPEGVPALHVSPDGKYVTAVAGSKLNLLPIAGAPAKPAIDVQPGESVVRWSADGRYVFLRQNEGLTAVKINRLDLMSRREEPWKELKPADPVGVRIWNGCYDAGWERVRVFVPARHLHVVSGERAEIICNRSAVRDHQQRSRAFDDALHRALQILRIERGEAFIQHHQLGVLQQRARDVEPAAFAMRKLPAGFAHHLEHSRGHASQQVAQAEFAANGFRLFEVVRASGSAGCPKNKLNANVSAST